MRSAAGSRRITSSSISPTSPGRPHRRTRGFTFVCARRHRKRVEHFGALGGTTRASAASAERSAAGRRPEMSKLCRNERNPAGRRARNPPASADAGRVQAAPSDLNKPMFTTRCRRSCWRASEHPADFDAADLEPSGGCLATAATSGCSSRYAVQRGPKDSRSRSSSGAISSDRRPWHSPWATTSSMVTG